MLGAKVAGKTTGVMGERVIGSVGRVLPRTEKGINIVVTNPLIVMGTISPSGTRVGAPGAGPTVVEMTAAGFVTVVVTKTTP